MCLVRSSWLVLVLLLGFSYVSAWADVHPVKGDAELPATEVPQDGIQLAPGGVIQAQGPVTITGTATVVSSDGGVGGSMSINDNGVKQFQTEEYGKKIKITDDPQKGIKIECVHKKGGTDETKKFEAKDAEELEKKHPEAFKLYQQYLGNQVPGQAGTIVAQGAIAGPIPVQPFPMPGGGFQLVPVLPGQIQGNIQLLGPAAGNMPIEAATAMMGHLSSEIKSAAKSGVWKDASKETKSELKKQADELKKQLLDLEKQFGEK